jgi:hypothetical protein
MAHDRADEHFPKHRSRLRGALPEEPRHILNPRPEILRDPRQIKARDGRRGPQALQFSLQRALPGFFGFQGDSQRRDGIGPLRQHDQAPLLPLNRPERVLDLPASINAARLLRAKSSNRFRHCGRDQIGRQHTPQRGDEGLIQCVAWHQHIVGTDFLPALLERSAPICLDDRPRLAVLPMVDSDVAPADGALPEARQQMIAPAVEP